MVTNGPGLAALLTYGQALLAAGDAAGAAVQFTRILNHRGLEPHLPEHAVALVWLGRAHAQTGNVRTRVPFTSGFSCGGQTPILTCPCCSRRGPNTRGSGPERHRVTGAHAGLASVDELH
ncbi:MAG TPA: hypothetical protein VMO26_01970 [Vicinamibacterales bacterium]|nr:hypothetical protein [Vicinamibacterales bacterium]